LGFEWSGLLCSKAHFNVSDGRVDIPHMRWKTVPVLGCSIQIRKIQKYRAETGRVRPALISKRRRIRKTKSEGLETISLSASSEGATEKRKQPMLTKIIAVCALSIGMATAAMAQQSGSGGSTNTGGSGSGNGAGTGSQSGGTSNGNGAANGNDTSGSHTNSNGQSQDCNAVKTGKNTGQDNNTQNNQTNDKASTAKCQ
jgi:uncharacterized membrane protein YgcG